MKTKLKELVWLTTLLWWLRLKNRLTGVDKREKARRTEAGESYVQARRRFSLEFPSLDQAFGLIMAIYDIVVLAMVVGVVWVLFLRGDPRVPNPGPMVPTIMPTPTAADNRGPLDAYDYISPRGSEELRSRENVVNTAILGGGWGARYMEKYGVILDESWKEVGQIVGLSGMNVGTNSVTLAIEGRTYAINKYQGFVLAGYPASVYLVDDQGRIWGHPVAPEVFIPIDQVVARLPHTIPANPGLSLTYK